MEAIANFVFQFDPRINLCIAFAIIPLGGLLILGLAGEVVKTMRDNRKRRRRYCR